MDRPTISQRVGQHISILLVLNLAAALVLITSIGLAIVRPENQRLWIIDIGVIGAVAIWWTGLIWRAVRAIRE